MANQKYDCTDPFELIVADNGSTDATVAVVETFRGRFDKLTLVDASQQKSAAYARNVGARSATGDILLFCDADDVVADDWIDAMRRALMTRRFVAGRIRWLNVDGRKHPLGRKMPQDKGLQPYGYPDFLYHAATANLGIHRSIHEHVGGFDENCLGLEDTDYCWRIQLSCVNLHFEPRAVVYMRTRGSLLKMIKQSWEWGRYNVFLYKRYRPLGMPRLRIRQGVGKWLSIFRRTAQLREKRDFEMWLWQLAWNFGRIDGCLRYGVLAI